MTRRYTVRTRSARAASSAPVVTPPDGAAGEAKISTRVRGVIRAATAPAVSAKPSSARVGTGTGTPPASRTPSAKAAGAGSRHQHLVPRFDQHLRHDEQGLAPAAADQHLTFGLVAQAHPRRRHAPRAPCGSGAIPLRSV